ncbi:Tryptophan synthase%2C alpha subunit (TrpA) [Mycobacteroides abscessus]|nr:Tryptophan synthase%2C alpha subunit (TrpA) [Mycobacteroides abscessus]
MTQPGRLTEVFDKCRAEERAALIGYLPNGYPDLDTSIELMTTLVRGGCDIIEVGIAYSDPMMDGPMIAAAAETALANGVRVADVFTTVRAITDAGGHAVVMSYWNPVLRYGVDAFARELAAAGGLGIITPDLIPDRPMTGSPPRTLMTWTGSFSSPRRPRPKGWRGPSAPVGDLSTRRRPWVSPVRVTRYPMPHRPW